MVPKTYDFKAILFHVGEKGKSSHKSINLDSFIRTMNSPEIRERLNDGKLLGLLTHDGRSRARQGHIPHHDLVMRDPDLVDILREVTIKDGVVYGYMDLTDTPAAERFKSLWKQGCKMGVSMSTELIEGREEFEIVELLGVDITLRPEFSSPIVETNFSENDSRRLDTNFNPHFEFGATVGEGEVSIFKDFSEGEPEVQPKVESGDFSLRESLREKTLQPAMVLRNRINEVVRWIKMSRKKTFDENKKFLRRYILEYVNEWIMLSLGNPKSDLNVSLGLRLNTYCNNRSAMRTLQIQLKRARDAMESSGYMSRQIQTSLNEAFSDVMTEIYNYINRKVGSEEKML